MRPPPSSDDFPKNEIYQKRPMRDRKSPRSMSEYELRKQRELAERVKQEKKQQENMKKDALELIEVLRVREVFPQLFLGEICTTGVESLQTGPY